MMIVRVILVETTRPVRIRPRIDTSPVKGHFLSAARVGPSELDFTTESETTDATFFDDDPRVNRTSDSTLTFGGLPRFLGTIQYELKASQTIPSKHTYFRHFSRL